VNGILKSWRERILQHDSQIAELRGEVEQLAERVKASKKVDLAIAPPPVANLGTDKRVVAKLTELEAAVEGTRERLDAVESDVAEAWQAIFRQASGANDEDEDEDDDAA
jgi:chromosome segregation ATPase